MKLKLFLLGILILMNVLTTSISLKIKKLNNSSQFQNSRTLLRRIKKLTRIGEDDPEVKLNMVEKIKRNG